MNTPTPSTRHEPQRVTLPDYLMRAIELVAADEQTNPQASFAAAVLISFGWALYERLDSLDPTGVQIPAEQWRQICGHLSAMSKHHSSDLDRVNYGLSWMNQGPSSFEPATGGQS